MHIIFMLMIPILVFTFIAIALLIIYLIKLLFFEKKVIVKVYKVKDNVGVKQ